MPIATLPLEHLLTSTDAADFSARRQLSDVSTRIVKAKKVVVVSGAGISCSSGIPDFRSEDGLYALVKARYPDAFFTGKDLFSSGLFSNPNTTSLFYTFIAELSLACNKAQPTRTHHFIHKLERTGRLLRSYTQNVDGLERRLGLESGGRGNGLKKKTTRNVELHGDLGRVRCVLCMTDYPAKEEWVGMFQEGLAPDCPACAERCESRVKRSARATTVGTLRPAIVLYDEPHPLGDDIGELQGFDLSRGPDILLIMGTSLKVHGLKRLVKDFAKAVHTPTGAAGKKGMVVFVNATPPGKEWEGIIDVHVHGTTDRWVEKVEEEWRRIKPGDWEVQTRLDGEMAQVKGVKEVEQVPKAKPGSKPGSKPKATQDKENVPLLTAGQLPTPRSSQSPRKSPFASLSALRPNAMPSSPLRPTKSVDALRPATTPAAPPTPLSPSKRRANMAHDDADGAVAATGFSPSPSKKNKSLEVCVRPPSTGLQATPGRGNLFASPRKQVQVPTMVRDEEVFGSPVKSSGKVVAKKTGVAATTRRKKPVAAGKENAEVEEAGTIKAKVAGRAAGTRRKVAAVAAVAA